MTHEQQLREAIKTVVELMKGNGFVVDDSDIMDGNMYITLCKPLNEDEGPEYDSAGFTDEDRIVNGQYRVIIDADMEAQDEDMFGDDKI